MLDIYKTRYQLADHPFRLSPDHHFSFDHPSYANAKAYLQYAISQGEGFVAIVGEPGTGKTTLIHGLLAELDKTRIQVATLTCAQLDPRNLIEMVTASFGLRPKEESKAVLLSGLEEFLIRQRRNGRHAVLIVDEAQGMSPDSLEELRLLSNLQHESRLLMQVFLVGHENLLDMIHAPGMEHLQQRLIAASHLEPLDLEETVTYVEHRLGHVGWQGDPAISEEALRLVHKFSKGIPRRINLICHRLFLYGGLEHKHELAGEDARQVIGELQKERVLPPGLASEDLSVEGIVAEPRDSGAPALALPRTESLPHTEDLVSTEQPGQRPMPSQPELHPAEGWQETPSASSESHPVEGRQETQPVSPESHPVEGRQETPSASSESHPVEGWQETPLASSESHPVEGRQETQPVSPEPEDEVVEQSDYPQGKRVQWTGSNDESLQVEPEEPDIYPGQGLRERLGMVIALLVGLIFVAVIIMNVGERLTGLIFPAPVETSGPGSTKVSGSEKKGVVVTAGSGTTATHGPDRRLVTKAGGKGVILRGSAAIASTSIGLDSPSVTEAELKDASATNQYRYGPRRPE